MTTLVPIPWQPAYFLTPDTLALLVAASDRVGERLQVSDAWRSYAEQKGYWDAYVAYLNGGPYAPIASNPDTGQRNHMRGAAFDLVRTDKAAQDACRAVGLVRDPDESWHWNNPRWASMPIIPTNTSTASSGATDLEEDDMTPDQAATLAKIAQDVKSVKDGIFYGGNSMPDGGLSLGQTAADIKKIVSQPVMRDTNGDGKPEKVSQIQELADTKTLALNLTAQVGALQKAVAAIATAQGVDPDAIRQAAQEGAEAALEGIVLKAVSGS